MWMLLIEHPQTGYVEVKSFPSAFLRALHIVGLSSHPVILRTQDPK